MMCSLRGVQQLHHQRPQKGPPLECLQLVDRDKAALLTRPGKKRVMSRSRRAGV